MRAILTVLLCVITIASVNGCGSMNSAKGDVSVCDQSFATKVDNPQIRQFNGILEVISDEASAEKAVNSFVSYVQTRLIRPETSIQSAGTIKSTDAIKEMARQETIARNVGKNNILSETVTNTKPLLDIGTVTDSINELGSSEGVRVDDETVIKIRNVVDISMPNINPNKTAGMTPLEAAVIGYAIVSGDDGTASVESISLPEEKLYAFIEMITK